MEVAQLRAWLARQLKQPDVPEWLWNWLVTERYVEEAGQYEDGPALLLKAAKGAIKLARDANRRATPPGRARQVEPGPLLNEYEQLRAQAFAERVAQVASAAPEARRFRQRACGGITLSSERAVTLLRSPATRIFTPDEFAQRDLSPADHEVIGIVENQGIAVGDVADGNAVDGEYLLRCAARFQSAQPVLVLERQIKVAVKLPAASMGQVPPEGIPTLPSHTFPDGNGTVQRVAVWPGSVLDVLHTAGAALAEQYHWSETEAIWFVLTGDAPIPPALHYEVELLTRPYGRHAAIRFAVAPWVSADTVLRAYRRLQREVLGGDNRPISTRNLALFRFVVAQQQSACGKITWREMLDRWNHAHPQWRDDDVRRFNRDYLRTERAVVFSDDRRNAGAMQ